jgi:hypothetical protein
MAVAFDPKRRREYVLLRDRALPEEQRSVFIIRLLDVLDRTRVADLRSGGMPAAAIGIELLRMSLDGWRNYPLPDGRPAPFERGGNGLPTDDTLRCVSDGDAAEILGETLREEEITPKQAGE